MMDRNFLGYPVKKAYDYPSALKEQVIRNYEKFNINLPVELETSISELPELPENFSGYKEFFEHAAQEVLGEEMESIDRLASAFLESGNIPLPIEPGNCVLQPGWSKYSPDGEFVEKVDYPDEEVLVFDTETFVKGGSYPIIASAVSANYSYIWLAKEFCESGIPESEWSQFDFVPLPATSVIIAHNAGYDIVRVKESYDWNHPIKFFDTMSAHIAVAGFASAQRFISVLKEKAPDKLTKQDWAILNSSPDWSYEGSTNSLVAVYNHHVAEAESWFGDTEPIRLSKAEKDTRNVFVTSNTMDEFVAMGEFRRKLIAYASKDTYYTAKIFMHLYPKYRSTKSSIVNLSGHLLISSARVPLTNDWFDWIDRCERMLEEDEKVVDSILVSEADRVLEQWLVDPDSTESDHFYGQLNWTIKRRKYHKSLDRFAEPQNTKKWCYVPEWYYPIARRAKPISTKADISHILLRICYNGKPLYKESGMGWGYFDKGSFVKIPHKDNPGANVGSVLSKAYIPEMEDGTISSVHQDAQRVFEIAIRDSFWVSVRDRVKERLVYFTKENFLLNVPSYIIHGTVTGRCVENLYLMMSSAKPNKIGTELKSKIQAPEGYVIVGADISAQEMNLASLLADNYAQGVLGSSPMSHQVLAGSKETFSDAHSIVAYELFLKPKGFKFIDGKWFIEED